jgi:hypothetical protein
VDDITALLIPSPSAEVEGVSLPRESRNIFGRLIRNPNRPDRPMRETRCTEMLCSVLLNSSDVRDCLIAWFAKLCGQTIEGLDGLVWEIDTEVSAGKRKRMDIRLRGNDGDTGRTKVLWAVEVKVAAGLHMSSDVRDDEQNETTSNGIDEEERDPVKQLINYDDWLHKAKVDQKAGIVLAMHDLTEELQGEEFKELKEKWHCTTWTDLGCELKCLLQNGHEGLLARHLLGFIKRYLWSKSAMSDQKLTFNELAFLKAASQVGNNCFRAVDKLVASVPDVFGDVFKNREMCSGQSKSGPLFFKSDEPNRVESWPLLENDEKVRIGAGVYMDSITVYIESPPKWSGKGALRAAIEKHDEKLKAEVGRWENFRVDSSWVWWDLAYRAPLELVLGGGEQDEIFKGTIRDALETLRESGILEAIQEACN